MFNKLFLVLTLGVCLVAGCGKSAPKTAEVNLADATDWGVIELAPDTPKHLTFGKQECTIEATPGLRGALWVVIRAEEKNVNPATGNQVRKSSTLEMSVPPGVPCTCMIGQKPVRFTLKLKKA